MRDLPAQVPRLRPRRGAAPLAALDLGTVPTWLEADAPRVNCPEHGVVVATCFLTGHAGCSVGTALGLCGGDDLLRPEQPRHVVAVIGDGAFPCGIVFEAMNHAGGFQEENLIVVLNNNENVDLPRVGGLAESLDRLRTAQFYTGLKAEVEKLSTACR